MAKAKKTTALTTRFSEMLAEREAVIAGMNPALRARFTAIVRQVEEQAKSNLRYYYWLGQQISELNADEDTYGTKVVEKIAAGLGIGVQVAYKAQAFATTYSEEELDELCGLGDASAGATGRALSWGHVIQLVTLPTRQERMKYARQAIAEGLTAADLQLVIQHHYGVRRQGGGRAFAKPKTPRAALVQIRAESEKLVRRDHEVWRASGGSIWDQLEQADPAEYTPELLATLEAVVSVQTELKTTAEENLKAARHLLRKVSSKVQQQQSAPAAAVGKKGTARRSGTRAVAVQAVKKTTRRKKTPQPAG